MIIIAVLIILGVLIGWLGYIYLCYLGEQDKRAFAREQQKIVDDKFKALPRVTKRKLIRKSAKNLEK